MGTGVRKRRRWQRVIWLMVASLVGLLTVLAGAGVALAPDYTARKTPAGHAVNTIRYLKLDDRTSIFVSAWLPPGLAPGEKVPALLRTERYADQMESGWLAKVLQFYAGQLDENYKGAKPILDAGYAFVLVQSPGSCQSSGPRPAEYPPAEVDAIGLAIDWVARQTWSSGRVGAFGGSYSGTTADMSCAALRPELRAVYPLKPDFDAYMGVIRPGGLGSSAFIRTWGTMIRAMDGDDVIAMVEAGGGEELPVWKRWLFLSMVTGLKRPESADMPIFRRAIEDHRANATVDELLAATEYRDTPLTAGGLAMKDIALHRYKGAIVRAAVSTYTRVGWIDAGAATGALQKFLTFATPHKLVLLPTGHRLGELVDLFGEQPDRRPEEPGWKKTDMLDYFDRHLKEPAPDPETRRIVYFTYGTNTWHETTTWPPQGITQREWFFHEGRTLSAQGPPEAAGADLYRVDFSADSGTSNRWMGQMGRPVHYGDRVLEDSKLLTYTSAPLAADLEITGSPTVRFHVASTHSDCAFHVYLEDVGPTGRVTYLTEGLLRAIHRRTRPPEEAPYVPLGVYRTFFKADALPLVPGEIAQMAITMEPISVVVRAGHSIRVALAAFDKALDYDYPTSGEPSLTVWRSAAHPSRVVLPVRAQVGYLQVRQP